MRQATVWHKAWRCNALEEWEGFMIVMQASYNYGMGLNTWAGICIPHFVLYKLDFPTAVLDIPFSINISHTPLIFSQISRYPVDFFPKYPISWKPLKCLWTKNCFRLVLEFTIKVPLKRNFRMWDFCLVIKLQPYLETLHTFFSRTVSENCFFSLSKLAG